MSSAAQRCYATSDSDRPARSGMRDRAKPAGACRRQGEGENEAVTHGHLLGGRVRYAQPRRGFRTGIEPVLLAAAVPAQGGQRVIEGGTGAGAALLCFAARVPGLIGVGIERDPALAALAARNITANGFAERLSVLPADLAALPEAGYFDHACANPPWHDPAGTASLDEAREAAKRSNPELLPIWAGQLASRLRPGATLTLILPATLLSEGLSALAAARCASPIIFPLWPKPGRAAKLVLLQARKGGAGSCRVLPGLVLHRAEGGYTAEAEAILREGGALALR
jgi:tRNA1Val (adenine37-N6)-methyltransferase